MVEPGKEVVTNRNPEACAEQIQSYLPIRAGRQTTGLRARHGLSVIKPISTVCRIRGPRGQICLKNLLKTQPSCRLTLFFRRSCATVTIPSSVGKSGTLFLF